MAKTSDHGFRGFLPSNIQTNDSRGKAYHLITRYLIPTLYICAWAMSLYLAYNYHTPVPTSVEYDYSATDDRINECGTTVSEAIAAGCDFDPVTFAWLPERCLDRELAAEFTSKTSWTLHADKAGTIKKSDMDFAANSTPTYITNRNHVLHCLYAWKRLHRLMVAGKPYHVGMSYHHTAHCTNMAMDALDEPLDQVRNEALVLVPAC